LKPASEAGFLKAVLDYAALRGWKSAHFRPARTESGWRTAVQGDGKGWPDLFLVRGNRAVAAELKMPGKKPSQEQEAWIAALRMTAVETFLWWPESWPEIEEVLR
jgi:hypothetical protein